MVWYSVFARSCFSRHHSILPGNAKEASKSAILREPGELVIVFLFARLHMFSLFQLSKPSTEQDRFDLAGQTLAEETKIVTSIPLLKQENQASVFDARFIWICGSPCSRCFAVPGKASDVSNFVVKIKLVTCQWLEPLIWGRRRVRSVSKQDGLPPIEPQAKLTAMAGQGQKALPAGRPVSRGVLRWLK